MSERAVVPGDVREFSLPTRIVAGWGVAAERLGPEVRALNVSRIAVVADRGVAEVGLLASLLEPVDGPGGAELRICARVDEDPTIDAAERAALTAQEQGAEAVLAIGGGSALGVGKAVAIRLRNEGDLRDWAGRDLVPQTPAPSIAIPTTAGSGGEVSNALVLVDVARERHMSIRGLRCAPDVALLDGQMLQTLPERPLVYAGLDALSHALESLWVRGSSRFSEPLAVEAAQLVVKALPGALRREPEAMQTLIEASAMANAACGNSGLGLIHALSSSYAAPLAHGYENGVLLPVVARFNHDHISPAGRSLVAEAEQLYDEIGFQPRFADGEVDHEMARRMAEAAMENSFHANNRRLAEQEEILQLLTAAGAGVQATN